MADGRRPEQRPEDLIVIQYQKAKPNGRVSSIKLKYKRITRFNTYQDLELYLIELSGGHFRTYPGGGDFPGITYTKYNDEGTDRQLRTEEWEDFAASVYQITVRRIKA